ncbi:hypothetical protein LTR53_008563 [Teratosphaeriaceae sp. CCFEE 6253]|nr:hypothetical protein LTR53_008563 [Teratosphaeriaceae sp. CCFEE 6253]
MALELPPEQRASYSAIIDSILSNADLDTISAKAIRKQLQAKVDYDMGEQKVGTGLGAPKCLANIDQNRERETSTNGGAVESVPTANGAAHTTEASNGDAVKSEFEPASPSHKRKASEAEDEDSLSDVQDTPPPKKTKKVAKPKAETDEQIARRLQAEFSAGSGRATRGGAANKRKPVVKKEKKEKRGKKKSKAKINSDDDSEVEGGSDGSAKPEKEKKGGFHRLQNLSEPLQALLGEAQLSRPQTVKKIWEYVKARDLQDPNDKRYIVCDDAMRAVFKTDKVHMFSMNKVLSPQLYPVEEV